MENSAQLDSKSTDLKELTEFINSTKNVREWKKGQAVKLIIQGFSYREVSQRLHISYSSIARAKKEYMAQGVSGLKLKYKGSQSYLTEVQKAELKIWLIEQPEKRNTSDLQRHIMEIYNLVFKSTQSYYDLLKMVN
ncbi:MAG: helix-turn-helix domain-containing protein [Microcoleus sp.]|uniref:helix-turn-helix domain-containing protein n=1 Tax=Microcoleus sp. TaxID=44472 RepID=UPI003C73F405